MTRGEIGLTRQTDMTDIEFKSPEEIKVFQVYTVSNNCKIVLIKKANH